ncbi:hypothetical protein [Maritalea sp.]|uniref:hypothetical protein n=1 Tax=Maritalea sp. TaxID=2003361 RepID=UPI003EF74422
MERENKSSLERPEDTTTQTHFSSLSMDWEEFGHHLEDSDLSDDQKRELIETVWNIMAAFVDLGLGIHPIQQAAPDDCGQNLDLLAFISNEQPKMLESSSREKQQFGQAADAKPSASNDGSSK